MIRTSSVVLEGRVTYNPVIIIIVCKSHQEVYVGNTYGYVVRWLIQLRFSQHPFTVTGPGEMCQSPGPQSELACLFWRIGDFRKFLR